MTFLSFEGWRGRDGVRRPERRAGKESAYGEKIAFMLYKKNC